MTIEEAIKEIKEASDSEVRFGDKEHHYDEVMKRVVAFGMAIKSLEAWEKIKAEIDQKQYDFMGNKDYDEGIRFGLMLAYQIIDKYKAESEDEENGCRCGNQ